MRDDSYNDKEKQDLSTLLDPLQLLLYSYTYDYLIYTDRLIGAVQRQRDEQTFTRQMYHCFCSVTVKKKLFTRVHLKKKLIVVND